MFPFIETCESIVLNYDEYWGGNRTGTPAAVIATQHGLQRQVNAAELTWEDVPTWAGDVRDGSKAQTIEPI